MNKIKVKIISLKNSKRRSNLKKLYSKCRFPVEIFDAIKPNENFIEQYCDVFDFDFFKYKYNSDIKRGELGCLLSHLKIYDELVSQSYYEYFLVCEDDAIPTFKVFELLENIDLSCIDILSFFTENGYVGVCEKIKTITENGKNTYNIFPVKFRFDSTVCYLISRKAASEILLQTKHSSTADWPDVAFKTNFYYSGIGYCDIQDVESEIGVVRRNPTPNLNRINNILKCPKAFSYYINNWLMPAFIRRFKFLKIYHVQNK